MTSRHDIGRRTPPVTPERALPRAIRDVLRQLQQFADHAPLAPELDAHGTPTARTITAAELRQALVEGRRSPVEVGLWVYAAQIRARRVALQARRSAA